MLEAFITILLTSPLPVALVLSGVLCIAIAIVGEIPSIKVDKVRARNLGIFGGVLIILALGSSYLVAFVSLPVSPNTNIVESTSAPTDIKVSPVASAVATPLINVTATISTANQQTEEPECSTTDFIVPLGGINPPVGSVICVPSGVISWISSDPARFTIPEIYEAKLTEGFTFTLFGPVKFVLSDVVGANARLDSRTNTSLLGNFDNKPRNLVYINGKVCEYVEYTGSGCP